MTPKERADELVDKYLLLTIDFPYTDTQDGQCIGNGYMLYNSAKQCALITVNEIIKSSPARSPINDSSDAMPHFRAVEYWQQVKQEIEKL